MKEVKKLCHVFLVYLKVIIKMEELNKLWSIGGIFEITSIF